MPSNCQCLSSTCHPQFIPLTLARSKRGEGPSRTLNNGAALLWITGGLLSSFPTYLQLPAIPLRNPSNHPLAKRYQKTGGWQAFFKSSVSGIRLAILQLIGYRELMARMPKVHYPGVWVQALVIEGSITKILRATEFSSMYPNAVFGTIQVLAVRWGIYPGLLLPAALLKK